MKFYSFLFILFTSLAQAQVDVEKAKLVEKTSQTLLSISALEKSIIDEEKKIESYKARIVEKQEHINNRNENKKRALDEVGTAIKGIKKSLRKNPRKEFFKCVQESLKKSGTSGVETCRYMHPAEFSPDEERLIDQWRAQLESAAEDMNYDIDYLTKDIKRSLTTIDKQKQQISRNQDLIKFYKNESLNLESKERDQLLLKKHSEFRACDSKTPELNLEEKIPFKDAPFDGPLFNIPRDHQDGIGSCYANVAKNLLIGVSEGKDIASFLDLALLSREKDSDIIKIALEGGDVCAALMKVEEKGFCPQNLSPVETGEKNVYTNGIIGKSSVAEQSHVIRLLQDFLEGKVSFKKKSPLIAEEYFKKAQLVINKLKVSPHIRLPLPVVRHNIPPVSKLKEIYLLNKGLHSVSEEKFISNYMDRYKAFYPYFVKALLEGKGSEKILEKYTEIMGPYLKEMKIEHTLEGIKFAFLFDAEEDLDMPNLQASLRDSLDFLKELTGKENIDEEAFLKECAEVKMQEELSFLSRLQPLLNHLKKFKLDPKALFNSKGEFKSPRDLMQLAIAPPCISEANRIIPEYKMSCDVGFNFIRETKESAIPEEEKIQKIRDKLLTSLLQGLPAGNIFETHINTIVGLRFNKESGLCEYRIRESQTGTSFWQSENEIYQKIDALTEVRRK